MKNSRLHLVLTITVILFIFSGASANAAQRGACSVLTLAEVRAIAGAPVVVLAAASDQPMVTDEMTLSNCMYTLPSGPGRVVHVQLMWAPKVNLEQIAKFTGKQNQALTSIKGDVLVLASVTGMKDNVRTFDRAASQQLLTALLNKL